MTEISVSARLFKSEPGTYLRVVAGGGVVRVFAAGRVQAVVVPPALSVKEQPLPAKGSPALLLERIRSRQRPRLKGRTAADMVLEDRR